MTFGDLALVGLAALLGPALSLVRPLRLPVVVGELAVGVAIGRTGAGWLSPAEPTFAFLAEVGFALVMFVAGTHVPLRSPVVRRGLAVGVARAAIVGLAAVPAGYAVARLFGTGHAALYAVLIASSSAALALPALGEDASVTAPGASMVAQIAVADTACIVALPLVLEPPHAARAAAGVGVMAVACLAAWAVFATLEARGWRRAAHNVSEDRLLALELRVSLVCLFALAALAVRTHVSVMLAGFGLGLAVAAVGEPRRLAKQLFALTEGMFAPLFFVWLGTSLDLRALAGSPDMLGLGLALGAAAVAVHALGALTRQPAPRAVMTAAQLGVPIAAATIGTRLGVLEPGEETALLVGALVTVAAVAVAARRASPPAGDVAGPARR